MWYRCWPNGFSKSRVYIFETHCKACLVGTTLNRIHQNRAFAGTAPVLGRPEHVLLAPDSPEQTEQFHFFTVKPGGSIDFGRNSSCAYALELDLTCSWHVLIVPYKVTMATRTHSEGCAKFGAPSQKVLCLWSTDWLA